MRDDFNRAAMEEKIARNIAAGFTFDGIKLALMNEQHGLMTRMKAIEDRVIELQDQIEYMNLPRIS